MQKHFNRYALTKEIASKPSGSVYLAHHTSNTSEKVALKVFKATSFTSEQQGQNFLYKIERIRHLRHSSIVPILDLGVEQGHPYVVREYLASNSLRHRLDDLSAQRLDLQEALSIIFQVGQALCYAHEHYILHGNLKPENIFFNDDGEVLLTDFGLASLTDVTNLDDQFDRQTMSYLAPEQFVGSITEKSDQYALACLAYELIAGRAPFSTESFPPVVSPPPVNGEPAKAIERQKSENRDQTGPIQVEAACENNQCADYRRVGSGNIRKFGKTRKGVQRWQCKTCQMTWSSSSMWIKYHIDLIPLTDLVPNLPEPIEEAILKATAKDPSERYVDISIFLRTLQIALALPPFSSTNSLIASPVTLLPTSITMPLEKTESQIPLTIHPLEDWQHMHNSYYASKTTAIPNSGTYYPSKTTTISNSDTYHPSKIVAILKTDAYRADKGLVEAPPQARRPRPSNPSPPILWLAFALSGIILLIGTMILYGLAPLHLPGSNKPVKSSPTQQPSMQVIHPSVQTTNSPIAQPSVQVTRISTATAIATLTSHEAEAPENTLTGATKVYSCSGCSGRMKVGNIGKTSTSTLQFNHVNKSRVGNYNLTIYYVDGDSGRTLYVSVNSTSTIVLKVSGTGDWNTVSTINIAVSLNAGNNTIKFYNPSGNAPDIDRIVV